MIKLTEVEATARLDSPANLAVRIKTNYGVGNHTGIARHTSSEKWKTDTEKRLIADIAVQSKVNLGIPYSETAKVFGIGRRVVSDYVGDRLSTGNNQYCEKTISKPAVREAAITDASLNVLSMALAEINGEKLQKSDANDLASVAVKMATINEKLNNKGNNGVQINVEIYAPKLARESHFDVIDV